MFNNFDDFDSQICPEELYDPNEDMDWDGNDENPIDDIMNDDFPFEQEYDEGSDRDNWEEQQVFLDGADSDW